MILQCINIIVGEGGVEDAGFEPGTSAPEVWCTTNKLPHLLSHASFTLFEPLKYYILDP